MAYIKGGNTVGQELPLLDGMDPQSFPWISLRVFDIQTGQTSLIATDPDVTQCAWTTNDVLLFTARPTAARLRQNTTYNLQADINEKPAIYQMRPTDAKPRILVAGGYSPLPSPDGTKVLFSSGPTTTQSPPGNKAPHRASRRVKKRTELLPEEEPVTPGSRLNLYVTARTGGTGRTLVHTDVTAGTLWPTIRWAPDSKSVVLLEQSYSKAGIGTAIVTVVDGSTGQSRVVTKLTTQDFKFIAANSIPQYAQFQILDISRDGVWACVKTQSFKNTSNPEYGHSRVDQLMAVNLKTGKTVKLAELRDDDGTMLGADWKFSP
jgi:hypothetical protein